MMNISGVLVRAYPEHIDSVGKILTRIDGVEIHGNNSDGRMVVTVEREDAAQMSDLIMQLQDVPGVLSTSMIYHHFDN